MESIAEPSTIKSHSSQSLKRSKPQNVKGSTPKPPKRRKKKVEESDDDDQEDAFSCRLSARTKETVMKLKKAKDPFDEEVQMVVDSVFSHLDQQPEEEVDLAESALLLSSVTQVYSSQVKNLHEEVLAMAERLTGRENPNKKGRKKKAEEANADANGESKEEKAPDEGDAEGEKVQASDSDKNNNVEGDATNPSGEKINEEGVPAENAEGEPKPAPVDGAEGAADGNPEGAGVGEGEIPVKEGVVFGPEPNPENAENKILGETPAPIPERRSERIRNKRNLEVDKDKERDYTSKKKKYDDDPPDLLSCHDEWNSILEWINSKGDIDFDEVLPPILEVQVGRKRKRVTINNNELNDADDGCETCHNAEAAPLDPKQEDEAFNAALSAATAVFDGQKYETLDHLSNDVQERFHDLIQEMHKLPYDYGLMQQDMFKAYQQKFLQAVTLLSQNSVLVKRSDSTKKEKEEEPQPSSSKQSETPTPPSDSQLSESEQAISSVADLLSQVRLQAAEDFNKGKQSKSDAEVPISQMIATLKRIICNRYKKWHVRTDGDKAVFRRIKEFEDKVKSVLKREKEQGLFDVKKYEMEVMDVTLKESIDENGDDYFCPTSPLALQDGAVSPRPSDGQDSRLWNLNAISRRISVAGSVDGSSWIRLFDIFSHMKKIDNSETCRHFYAVLALLSHKNLSVNYDALFSHESAKLITKLLKRSHQRDIQAEADKYPVGAKIMTSRCPDIDRDEVFLAPVFNSESLQQALEQDYLSSTSGYQSDSQQSSSTSFSPAPLQHPAYQFQQQKLIQDAINEFVDDPGEPLHIDNLFGRRRRKN